MRNTIAAERLVDGPSFSSSTILKHDQQVENGEFPAKTPV
jgi:hypothetical protein